MSHLFVLTSGLLFTNADSMVIGTEKLKDTVDEG